ncbi:hypothetical protein HDU84_002812 [Entophlyctis sp. JEL0112]|nr:hypothetical protein HDU84_002812 [Entophlyctis sp. JEL0112]
MSAGAASFAASSAAVASATAAAIPLSSTAVTTAPASIASTLRRPPLHLLSLGQSHTPSAKKTASGQARVTGATNLVAHYSLEHLFSLQPSAAESSGFGSGDPTFRASYLPYIQDLAGRNSVVIDKTLRDLAHFQPTGNEPRIGALDPYLVQTAFTLVPGPPVPGITAFDLGADDLAMSLYEERQRAAAAAASSNSTGQSSKSSAQTSSSKKTSSNPTKGATAATNTTAISPAVVSSAVGNAAAPKKLDGGPPATGTPSIIPSATTDGQAPKLKIKFGFLAGASATGSANSGTGTNSQSIRPTNLSPGAAISGTVSAGTGNSSMSASMDGEEASKKV